MHDYGSDESLKFSAMLRQAARQGVVEADTTATTAQSPEFEREWAGYLELQRAGGSPEQLEQARARVQALVDANAAREAAAAIAGGAGARRGQPSPEEPLSMSTILRAARAGVAAEELRR